MRLLTLLMLVSFCCDRLCGAAPEFINPPLLQGGMLGLRWKADQSVRLEASPDLKRWNTLAEFPAAAQPAYWLSRTGHTQQFYRLIETGLKPPTELEVFPDQVRASVIEHYKWPLASSTNTTEITLAGPEGSGWKLAVDAPFQVAGPDLQPLATSGILPAGRTNLPIKLDHRGLAPGEYAGELKFSNEASSHTVKLTLTVQPKRLIGTFTGKISYVNLAGVEKTIDLAAPAIVTLSNEDTVIDGKLTLPDTGDPDDPLKGDLMIAGAPDSFTIAIFASGTSIVGDQPRGIDHLDGTWRFEFGLAHGEGKFSLRGEWIGN